MSQSLPLLFSLIKVPQPFVPYPAPAVQLLIPLCLFSFPLFIGLLPYLRKYCQWTVCEKAHEKETFVWIYYVYLSHSTSKQNILISSRKCLYLLKGSSSSISWDTIKNSSVIRSKRSTGSLWLKIFVILCLLKRFWLKCFARMEADIFFRLPILLMGIPLQITFPHQKV